MSTKNHQYLLEMEIIEDRHARPRSEIREQVEAIQISGNCFLGHREEQNVDISCHCGLQ